MAARSKQQPELSLQGSLFGAEPEPQPLDPTGHTDQVEQDTALEAAARRPRRRPPGRVGREADSDAPADTGSEADGSSASPQDDDLPAWHHHSLVEPEQLTPMLRHYVELKRAHPERVLLYRLGDFFECFFEDAIQLSRLLELTLTGKEGGKAIGRVPMAGIPHHAAERYCTELVRRGLSVALCDQLEATPAKGELLKRAIPDRRILRENTKEILLETLTPNNFDIKYNKLVLK